MEAAGQRALPGRARPHPTLNPAARLPPPPCPALPRSLRHSEEGLASVSLSGDEFGLTLGRALDLDNTHQVGGLQGKGLVFSRLDAGSRAGVGRAAGVPVGC